MQEGSDRSAQLGGLAVSLSFVSACLGEAADERVLQIMKGLTICKESQRSDRYQAGFISVQMDLDALVKSQLTTDAQAFHERRKLTECEGGDRQENAFSLIQNRNTIELVRFEGGGDRGAVRHDGPRWVK